MCKNQPDNRVNSAERHGRPLSPLRHGGMNGRPACLATFLYARAEPISTPSCLGRLVTRCRPPEAAMSIHELPDELLLHIFDLLDCGEAGEQPR